MTLKQLVSRIGSEATLSIEQMAVRVIVRDVRHAYGRTHYLVEPVAGSGPNGLTLDAWILTVEPWRLHLC